MMKTAFSSHNNHEVARREALEFWERLMDEAEHKKMFGTIGIEAGVRDGKIHYVKEKSDKTTQYK